MRSVTPIAALGIAIALSALQGCYQVPVTGRSAIIAVDDKAVLTKSAEEFDKMKKSLPVSRDRAMNERVQQVGGRLAKVVFWDMPNADWEFVVFAVPNQVNAFALPGGKVGVFSGLFKIIRNDDQLASVLAHEIAHVTAKHTHERLTQGMAVQAGGLLAGAATAVNTGSIYAGSSVMQGAGMLGGLGVMAYDRRKEKEADHIGLIYMARAGYNPEESIKVIESLEAESAGRAAPFEWLSTHPTNPERIIQLMDLMPKALEIYHNGGHKPAPVLVK